jgi:hypothetical protein
VEAGELKRQYAKTNRQHCFAAMLHCENLLWRMDSE